jgi:hypothetical protein
MKSDIETLLDAKNKKTTWLEMQVVKYHMISFLMAAVLIKRMDVMANQNFTTYIVTFEN